jgi:hypothetical protein
MDYKIILFLLCLQPWWPVFTGAVVGSIAALVFYKKGMQKYAVATAIISAPLIAWAAYILLMVIHGLNKPL